MIDQTFSSKNIREIFDKENRQGKDIEDKFKTAFFEPISQRLELQKISKKIRSEQDNSIRLILTDNKKELKDKREKSLTEVFDKIANNINKPSFNIFLKQGGIYGKQSYKLENSPENFFVSKKIQENIHKTYKVKQKSRYEILSQLLSIIEDGFPKYVIRTDIKGFYESIPQIKITEKLKSDSFLSIRTQRFIGRVLSSYNKITDQELLDNPKGVPRGVGISAYLAELYMRKIDNKIREIPDLTYYARYVDDIIVVFTPHKIIADKDEMYLNRIKEIIRDNELTINQRKTTKYDLTSCLIQLDFNNPKSKLINYLGYMIGFEKENRDYNLFVEMSNDKLKRYKSRIKESYFHFNNKKNSNRKRAFNILLARMQYLTTNTRLVNNKSKVFVGIYYSNPFLSDGAPSLKALQNSHKWWISRCDFTDREKELLLKCCFIKGFKEKKFLRYPLMRKKYKNHNGKKQQFCTNKGVVQFGLTDIIKIWD